MAERFDDAVVGAGILGLAHAYHLARRGRRVAVFERSPRAQGASVRNFGMLWPIGQPAGPRRRLALRSRELWLEVLRAAGLWHDPVGSLHLAYHDDEVAVLGEFARAEGDGVALLDPARARERSPAVRPDGLKAALWSAAEVCVDPRAVVAGLPDFLARAHGVRFFFGHAVTGYDRPAVTAGGRTFAASHLYVCSGDDLTTLYPETYQALGLVRCKLQMLRTPPRPGWRLGPMLAAGLTLRHYTAFADCPSLPALKRRLAEQYPEYERYGIHVMASQNGLGELVLGDSHEYGDAIEPFDKERIDALILDYLRTFLDVPDLTVAARWHGVYAKHPTEAYLVRHPAPEVTVTTGVGGAGMTLAFGVAEVATRDQIGDELPPPTRA
jgi:FAD dependent oxidoreductase TIGR03364